MKIAFPADGKILYEHFGHCPAFELYEICDGKVIGNESVENPGHKPGFLPNFLADKGVNVIISGGMGGGAIEIFNERNIEVITGATGLISENLEKYLKGELVSTGSVCNKHEHKDECGE